MCEALDTKVLHVDVRSMRLASDPSHSADEHLLHLQLRLLCRFAGGSHEAFADNFGESVARAVQAAGLPSFQAEGVQCWLAGECY